MCPHLLSLSWLWIWPQTIIWVIGTLIGINGLLCPRSTIRLLKPQEMGVLCISHSGNWDSSTCWNVSGIMQRGGGTAEFKPDLSAPPPPPPALFLDSTVLGYVTECWKQKSHFLTVTVKTWFVYRKPISICSFFCNKIVDPVSVFLQSAGFCLKQIRNPSSFIFFLIFFMRHHVACFLKN